MDTMFLIAFLAQYKHKISNFVVVCQAFPKLKNTRTDMTPLKSFSGLVKQEVGYWKEPTYLPNL
jgi:hypothetical protein